MPAVSGQHLLQGRAGRLSCTHSLPKMPPSAQHRVGISVWDLACVWDVGGTNARCQVGARHPCAGLRPQHPQAALRQAGSTGPVHLSLVTEWEQVSIPDMSGRVAPGACRGCAWPWEPRDGGGTER